MVTKEEETMNKRKLVIVAVVVVLVGIFTHVLNVGMKKKERLDQEWALKYDWIKPGEMVKVKLTGEKVQVRRAPTRRGWAHCLVPSGRNHRDGIVSADSFVREYVVVRFHERELEPWDGGRSDE